MARVKFLCDADRCIECNACVTACKNEHEVPWGINRRRVVTINDGKPGERSVSMACMHCTDAPCAAVCPVSCFYTTADGVVLHSKDLCIGCGYCFYACPFGAPQYPKVGNFGSRGKMDKCTYCAGGPEAELHAGRIRQIRRQPSRRGQAADLRRDVLDQVAARRRRRDHRRDLQGARDEARLRLGHVGLEDRLQRFTDRLMHRPSRSGAAASRNQITERALCLCQAHFQISIPGRCALPFALLFVLRASRRRAAFLQADRRSRSGRQAPECAEGGRQDHRADIHPRRDGRQPDPARRARLARLPPQQAADHRRRCHPRHAGRCWRSS